MTAVSRMARNVVLPVLVAAALAPAVSFAACVTPTGGVGDLGVLASSTCFASGSDITSGFFSDFFTFTVSNPLTALANVSLNTLPQFGSQIVELDLYSGPLVGNAVTGADHLVGFSTGLTSTAPLSGSFVSGSNYFYEVIGIVPNGSTGSFTGNVFISAVPEPGTWAMIGAGVLVLAGAARRRRIG